MEELAKDDYQHLLRLDPTYHLEHVQEMEASEEVADGINASKKREFLEKILP